MNFSTKINDNSYSQDLNFSLEIIQNGGVILCPTDTVWGLSCDATSESAVEKIYQIKNRPPQKSLIVLVNSLEMIRFYIDFEESYFEKVKCFIDQNHKPTTVIYPKSQNLAKNLTSDNSIAIRIVKQGFCSDLIAKLNKPLVSTSANFSGEPTPCNFAEINPKLIEKVDYTVQHKQNDNQKSASSTIIKLGSDGEIEIIRE